ncbi:F510_1955 family glycosylhydrolase [Alteribacter natronophilus]|uniref:F510_1955 family glycosylhydrolase n=1 Tax=Alteribacter natronophilus TaxID=2583810 RepID=UPI00110F39DD|nr:hypothetical protein [Alteribacter natronophilus]TMW70155.1 hypothetical protein FGB90_18510 [Alteribacter natronophilus]
MKKTAWFGLSFALAVAAAACQNEDAPENGAANGEADPEENGDASQEEAVDLDGDEFYVHNDELQMTHIHGLGYAGNDGLLYVATHHGLAIYDDGSWYETAEEKNDYMGFNAVESGFYTSGHPGEASSFDVDPIGLVKSTDGGKTLESLDLLGETDFHVKGTGYYSNAVYVYNPAPSDRLEETGLYYTLDDAESWEKAEGDGLPEANYDQGGYPDYSVAVHPVEESTLAVGTAEGLFLSEDYGNTFEQTTVDLPVMSAVFHEEQVYAAVWDGEVRLVQLDGEEVTELNMPEIDEQDGIQYIAVNPEYREEIAVTTFMGDGFLSEDSGAEWKQIIEGGGVHGDEH